MFGQISSSPPKKKQNSRTSQESSSQGGKRKETESKKKEEEAWFENYGGEAEEEAPRGQTAARAKEKKLLAAMASLCLKLDDERAQNQRDQNFVLTMKSSHLLAAQMSWSLDHYKEQGEEAYKKAADDGGNFKGNPLGKKPTVMLAALLFRLGELITTSKEKLEETKHKEA